MAQWHFLSVKNNISRFKAGCPMGLDIPMLLSGYNDLKFASAMTVAETA